MCLPRPEPQSTKWRSRTGAIWLSSFGRSHRDLDIRPDQRADFDEDELDAAAISICVS